MLLGNRLDLRANDLAAEVDRLMALSASHADVSQPSNAKWVVRADSENNVQAGAHHHEWRVKN